MTISFTGHRNKLANPIDLDRIASEYPGDIWIHGGAVGFDRQVEEYASAKGIKTVVIRPDYEKYGRRAPLIRNDKIVGLGDVLVALYDGRIGGGTYYTINKAMEMGKRVIILSC
jgi:hypothetical protein